MSAKWSISNLPALAAICLLLLWCSPLSAQERDTVIIVKHDTVYLQRKPDTVVTGRTRHSRYDRRVHRYRKRWEALIPTHTKIQFAGNMGLLSLGTGWDYGKRNQWETDIFLGVLPKYQSDCTKLTFTLKQNYIPWSVSFDRHWAIEPFYCGLYVTTIAGEDFWKKEPGRYPNRYYNFSTKLRPYIFIGQRVAFSPEHDLLRSVSLFYEVSTCELYLVSKATNSSLSMKDILRFSFGVKVQLFRDNP